MALSPSGCSQSEPAFSKSTKIHKATRNARRQTLPNSTNAWPLSCSNFQAQAGWAHEQAQSPHSRHSRVLRLAFRSSIPWQCCVAILRGFICRTGTRSAEARARSTRSAKRPRPLRTTGAWSGVSHPLKSSTPNQRLLAVLMGKERLGRWRCWRSPRSPGGAGSGCTSGIQHRPRSWGGLLRVC